MVDRLHSDGFDESSRWTTAAEPITMGVIPRPEPGERPVDEEYKGLIPGPCLDRGEDLPRVDMTCRRIEFLTIPWPPTVTLIPSNPAARQKRI